VKRREFLKQTGLAAGVLSVPSAVHARAGSKRYDVIIVGAGAAGSIVATRLVERFPRKSIELGERA
jgi:ribulose 1,5-bisphosphate synthetase/thiazole synthase